MTYTYILHQHAQEDYELSLEWYMERSIDAAEKFVRAIENALQLVSIIVIDGETSTKTFMKSL